MPFVIYGTHSKPIEIDEILMKCASCEVHTWHDLMVSSKYLHVYGIPVCPIEKNADTICKKCGLKLYGRSFNKETIPNYNDVKSKFRHPIYVYTLSLIIVILILTSIVSSFFS